METFDSASNLKLCRSYNFAYFCQAPEDLIETLSKKKIRCKFHVAYGLTFKRSKGSYFRNYDLGLVPLPPECPTETLSKLKIFNLRSKVLRKLYRSYCHRKSKTLPLPKQNCLLGFGYSKCPGANRGAELSSSSTIKGRIPKIYVNSRVVYFFFFD